MNYKLKLLPVLVAGVLLAGCNNDKTASTDTAVLKETDTQTIVADAATIAKDVFVAKEGVHYEVLEDALVLDEFEGTTLSEFFWLGCGHCQAFEPAVQEWKTLLSKEGSFRVVKTAVPGSERWSFDSAVYYTLRELGATDSQVSLMLKLYQKEAAKHRRLPNLDTVLGYFEEVGFDKEKAKAILDDQEKMADKLLAANKEFDKTGANGVPVFVVNGKYKIKFDEVETNEDILNIIKSLGDKK